MNTGDEQDPGHYPGENQREVRKCCIAGGCLIDLGEDALACYKRFLLVFETLIEHYAPAEKAMDCEPLLVAFHDLEEVAPSQYVVVAFHTRKKPFEVVLMKGTGPLTASDAEQFPFQVALPRSPELRDHRVFCKHFASLSLHWSCLILDVCSDRDELFFFDVVGARILDDAAMNAVQMQRDAAREMKRALSAVHGLHRGRARSEGRAHRARGLEGRAHRARGLEGRAHRLRARGQRAARSIDSQSSSSTSDESHSTSGPSSPSSSRLGDNMDVAMSDAVEDEVIESDSEVVEVVAEVAEHQEEERLAVRVGSYFPREDRREHWGPFQLAPIYSKGVFRAWGGTCFRHLDPCQRRQKHPTCCKKTLAFYSGRITEQEAKYRMKRWLLAGMDDRDWPAEKRTHHRNLGGDSLCDFSSDNGPSERVLDEQAHRLL